ncbi:hypothetical protein EPN15_04750 [Patescibacteria group bacterium]|nr:MAG: hypothetical protein EPN15_04750 [Patescibacteria group bacterium]
MPEIISRYPEITLKVLKESGARCGEGLPQKILTKCPEERFCSLSTGEICVYGADQINKVTQFSAGPFPMFVNFYIFIILAILIFFGGFFLGRLFFSKKPQ